MSSAHRAGRRIAGLALAVAAVAVGACGSDDDPDPAPGSPQRPLVASHPERGGGGHSNEGARGDAPSGVGFRRLVERQGSRPARARSVCNLVTRSEAGRVAGRPFEPLVEAPLGPTCVYVAEDTLVTVSVQSQSYRALTRALRGARPVTIAGRRGVCATQGRGMLVLPVEGSRVLTVGGDCALAERFAALAAPRVSG